MMLFFGPWGRDITPALWTPGRKVVTFAEAAIPPAVASRIDGGYCPGVRVLRDETIWPATDSRPEGVLRHYYETKNCTWTILAGWDRSIDPRPSGNVAFLTAGMWAAEAMLKLAQGGFPDVFARLPEQISVVGF